MLLDNEPKQHTCINSAWLVGNKKLSYVDSPILESVVHFDVPFSHFDVPFSHFDVPFCHLEQLNLLESRKSGTIIADAQ